MNTTHQRIANLTLAALAAAAGLASAQTLAPPADIARGTLNGHAYQNGGISKEQVANMDRHMRPYDLRLTFSEGKHNAFAAGLQLRINDAQGHQVFALDDAGPMTDLSLPAGHYRVVASFGGVQRAAGVDIKPGKPAELYLHWPKDET